MIAFDADICGDIDAALQREWLETNGLGGFASSTIIGLNTRRYHGLLVAATQPPVGRLLLLSKLEETLVMRDVLNAVQHIALSANQYPGALHPQGYRHLIRFRLDPFPIFTYQVDGVTLEKTVFMLQGENTVCVRYALIGANPAWQSINLQLRPLVAFRDFHATTHENDAFDRHVKLRPGQASLQPYAGLPALHLGHDAVAIDTTGNWYRNFEYAVERARGLDFREDLFNPCLLTFDLTTRASANIVASTDATAANVARIERARNAEQLRRAVRAGERPIFNAGLQSQHPLSDIPIEATPPTDRAIDALLPMLRCAADQFLVQRGPDPQDTTIIAGYHWFADWGRDSMIALPGLTLVTGNIDIAKGILRTFARHLDQGMLPNRFPDSGEAPEYNTVDATLWMFEATRALVQHSGDLAFVREHLYQPLLDVIDWHVRGTRFNIHVDGDGLLFAGQPGVQLTWMDAKVGDWVVTPRIGKPVEIQALWFNALRVMQGFAHSFADLARHDALAAQADAAQHSFRHQFWNAAEGCLFDVVDGDQRDASIRPNQIFAVSLANSMLEQAQASQVVDVVQRELLTPLGLRSLSPRDSRYQPRYGGDMRSRDAAYHQGTVWSWLMGPFISAYVKVNGRSDASRAQARRWLNRFVPHMREAGLGHISEVFDGDAPHVAGGCIAQAWSVAELLRVAVEDMA